MFTWSNKKNISTFPLKRKKAPYLELSKSYLELCRGPQIYKYMYIISAIADGDIVVGSVDQAVLLHDNVTIVCQMMTNSSGQLDSVDDPVQYEWTFLPFNSTTSNTILGRSDNSSKFFGSVSGIKYYRPHWTELWIVSVDARDVGTYTCIAPSGELASQDIYVIGNYTLVIFVPAIKKKNTFWVLK